MSHTVVRILGAAILLGSPMFCAQSAELGFYVGGAFGNGSKTIDKSGYDQYALALYASPNVNFIPNTGPGDNMSSIDKTNPGYAFVAGYRLFNHLAVEGGYMDLGKFRYQAQSNGNLLLDSGGALPTTLNTSVNSQTGGFALTALGILPLTYRLELYARGGIMFSSNERTTFVSATTGGRLKDKANGSSTDLLAGVGAGFTFAEIYTLRGEYQRVFDAGDDTVGEGDADLVTVGVTVRF